MITGKVRSFVRQIWSTPKKDPDRFLLDVSGVIHVGANTGQERDLYNLYDLNVLWIEPIPSTFAELTGNIMSLKKQRALQALVTNVDNQEYNLYISNNEGLSSSILALKQHKDIWPDVEYMDSIALRSTTLVSLLKKEKITLSDYQALVMDTQGSELLVLQGSIEVLNQFVYIKTEVPNFEAYEGCCQISDIAHFMKAHKYEEFSRRKFAHRKEGGSYYDIVYKKKNL
jgi:FkbM family methyltransferase